MGNCISISIPLDSLDGMVSRPLEEKGWCTHKLIKNLRDLETTMEELKCRRDDLSRRFAIEEDRDLQRLSGFQVWLHNVETVEVEVNALLNDRDVELQRLCLCRFCSKSIILSHRYGKIVFLTLMKISKLKGDVFGVIAEQASTSVVEEKPLLRTIVGQEVMLERAWNHLMDDGVGIMGIYGMGGVGKTILFTQIFNKLSHVRGGFDYVIWVVVSKDIQVNRIQDVIAQRVGLGGGILNQKDQQAVRLFNFLKNKRFVLLLDDVWDKVDLAEIGVPLPTRENRCKVTFTTRSQEVCAHMGDENPMEVRCLEETDAFDLFQKKVGERTLGSDPGISHLARIVAKKCYGLPLALNIIGEVMSCKRTIQEWRHGVTVLSSNAADFSGMEDYIFPILKYSYDNLRGEQEKSCLLYCAVYPEDAKILKDKLIEYWICEDIIDGSEGIERAEDKGYDIIGSLVRASLLIESVDDQDGRTFVIMHDAVREMALWIATTMGTQKDGFIVRASVGLNEIPKVKNWEVVKRMSLMDNKIHHLVGSPKCMELTTLLLQNTWLDNISSEFFSYMPKLVVLDLSDNSFLSELPKEISKLVSLQYLSLRETRIRHLPKGLLELKNLIYFDLEETYALESIAGISSLHHLKVLKLAYSGFPWDINTVKELECMEHVEILTTTIDPGPEQLLSSKKLMSRTRFLGISGFVSSLNRYLESCGISLPESMDKLRCFNIKFCGISEIKMGRLCSFLSLVEVLIEGCECLRELTFLMFAPNLRILYVEGAKDLEDIINKERACEGEISEIEPFQKLEYLQLVSLPKLKNIFWSPLPLSCLKRIDVIKCPILKKLPLSAKSCNQINELVIQYTEKEWINGVRWEDRATKSRFLPSCVYIQSEIDEISHFLP